MDSTTEEIISAIRICLASVEKQRQSEAAAMLQQYLDGYEAACRMLLEILEKKK